MAFINILVQVGFNEAALHEGRKSFEVVVPGGVPETLQ